MMEATPLTHYLQLAFCAAADRLRRMKSILFAGLMLAAGAAFGAAAFQPNYDEAKVPEYRLPDPLVLPNGDRIQGAKTWEKTGRPATLELFAENIYGRAPGKPAKMKFHTWSLDRKALDGKATRKEIMIYFTGKTNGPKMELLIYVPNQAPKPAPVFLGMNYYGNQCIHPDPAIRLTESWSRPAKDGTVENKRATEKSRGLQASRWNVEKILAQGFAVATFYYCDVEPDHATGWKDGVRAGLSKQGADTLFRPDAWGALAAHAWGLSRAMDYLEKDRDLDAKRVAVFGHSRHGKAALWAGAADERFAIVISNDSGCGGAALSRRCFGETVERINTAFPHWFCGNFKQYNNHEDALPVDQHQLIALIAPRPVYVASAEDDKWADPKGEFLSAKHAEPVYRLYGRAGLGVAAMPPVNQPVGDYIGYHIRTGPHDINEYDWEQYLKFARRHFKMP
jgi:hypothetical protein